MNYKIMICIIMSMMVFSCGVGTNIPISKGSYIRLTPAVKKGSAKNANRIEIFYQKKPGFAYREVGIIEAVTYKRGFGRDPGLKDLFPELKKQAALVGADAIHKIEMKRHNQTGNTIHATAVAIVRK